MPWSRVSLALAVAAAVGLVPLGCSRQTDESDTESEAIQGGTEDSDHRFAVGVRAGTKRCGGVLVAPNLVITSRQCVAVDSTSPDGTSTTTSTATSSSSSSDSNTKLSCSAHFLKSESPSVVSITTASQIDDRSSHAVQEIVVPRDNGFCSGDLALLILKDNVPTSEAVPASPLVHGSMTDREILGKGGYFSAPSVALLGYGGTDTSGAGKGTRRLLEKVEIRCIPGDEEYDCKDRFIGGEFHANQFQLETGACVGDLGTPAITQKSFDEGRPIALGVATMNVPDGDTCAYPIYSRFDRFAPLIITTAQAAAKRGNYPEPAWISGNSATTPGTPTTPSTPGATDPASPPGNPTSPSNGSTDPNHPADPASNASTPDATAPPAAAPEPTPPVEDPPPATPNDTSSGTKKPKTTKPAAAAPKKDSGGGCSLGPVGSRSGSAPADVALFAVTGLALAVVRRRR